MSIKTADYVIPPSHIRRPEAHDIIREAREHHATILFWDEDSDPSNPGWLYRWYDLDGNENDYPHNGSVEHDGQVWDEHGRLSTRTDEQLPETPDIARMLADWEAQDDETKARIPLHEWLTNDLLDSGWIPPSHLNDYDEQLLSAADAVLADTVIEWGVRPQFTDGQTHAVGAVWPAKDERAAGEMVASVDAGWGAVKVQRIVGKWVEVSS